MRSLRVAAAGILAGCLVVAVLGSAAALSMLVAAVVGVALDEQDDRV